MEAMARLVVRGGPEPGREFPLTGERAVIGRDPDVAVSLPSRTVSRHHAQIWCEHRAYSVEDLGSRNGTYMNGKRLQRRTPLPKWVIMVALIREVGVGLVTLGLERKPKK
jgi:pSer/pThr/pTyr-binding forkhead associated (FHA) protein